MKPKFSIVIPTVGRLEFLKRALHSALRQQDQFADYEIVVLDNFSSGGTWDYLQTMESSRVRIVRNPHRLPQAENWNAAVRLCDGEFVYVLQDDNILVPGMLATVASAAAKHEDLELVYFPARYMDEADRPLLPHTRIWGPEHGEELLPAPDALMRFAREYTVATSFLVFSRAVFDRYGEFDVEGPSYPVMLDIEFILRWMTHCGTLVLPESLAMHRVWAGTRTFAEAWSPEMFTSMSYMVNRVFRAAAESSRLDADGLDDLRRSLVQTFLVDIFEDWAAARPHFVGGGGSAASRVGEPAG